tara:strand:- start:983 stop:1372 length:390 start_codon:yes stop_codon:yes gene_type:complete
MTDKESIKIINEAIALQLRKSNDYQNGKSWIKQADYYPRGVLTMLDIVYAKVLRMYSVVEAMDKDPDYTPNFESVEDSCKDLINYASFIGAYIRGGVEGQDPNKDFLNREKKPKTTQSLFDLKSEYIDE